LKTKQLTYLLALLFLSACYNVEKPEKPDNLLNEDKMVEVLVEMSLMYSAKAINKRELEKNNIVPDAFIYEKHNIDSLQFAQSNYYYSFDIKRYDEIYKKVRDSLNKLKTKYKAIKDEEQRVKDSIKDIKKRKKDSLLKVNNPKVKKPNRNRTFATAKDSILLK